VTTTWGLREQRGRSQAACCLPRVPPRSRRQTRSECKDRRRRQRRPRQAPRSRPRNPRGSPRVRAYEGDPRLSVQRYVAEEHARQNPDAHCNRVCEPILHDPLPSAADGASDPAGRLCGGTATTQEPGHAQGAQFTVPSTSGTRQVGQNFRQGEETTSKKFPINKLVRRTGRLSRRTGPPG
jgi:hypothetical protein